MSSTGTILAVVDAKAQGEVEEVLSRSGLKGSFIGEFKEDKKRILIKEGKETGFPLIGEDPYSRILSWTN
jgi:hydrogenase maturation factor